MEKKISWREPEKVTKAIIPSWITYLWKSIPISFNFGLFLVTVYLLTLVLKILLNEDIKEFLFRFSISMLFMYLLYICILVYGSIKGYKKGRYITVTCSDITYFGNSIKWDKMQNVCINEKNISGEVFPILSCLYKNKQYLWGINSREIAIEDLLSIIPVPVKNRFPPCTDLPLKTIVYNKIENSRLDWKEPAKVFQMNFPTWKAYWVVSIQRSIGGFSISLFLFVISLSFFLGQFDSVADRFVRIVLGLLCFYVLYFFIMTCAARWGYSYGRFISMTRDGITLFWGVIPWRHLQNVSLELKIIDGKTYQVLSGYYKKKQYFWGIDSHRIKKDDLLSIIPSSVWSK